MPERLYETALSTGGTLWCENLPKGGLAVFLDHPDAPEDMRPQSAGRLIDGGWQAHIFMNFAVRAEVLRVLADILDAQTPDASTARDRCGRPLVAGHSVLLPQFDRDMAAVRLHQVTVTKAERPFVEVEHADGSYSTEEAVGLVRISERLVLRQEGT
jgi:hypothetical protein